MKKEYKIEDKFELDLKRNLLCHCTVVNGALCGKMLAASEDDEIDIEDDPLPEDQIKSLEDQLLRAQAEVQNVRRIAAQEVTKARLFGVESLAKEFLSVADNLERAIQSCEDTEVKEGLELTLKSLENSLKTFD